LKRRIVFLLFICLLAAGSADASAQSNTGTIRGRVHLTGKLPGNPVIRMRVDPACSKLTAGKLVVQEYVVAALDGSLANTFVRLQGSFPPTSVPAQPVVIDQSGCIYAPRVIGVRVGQSVQIKNSDPLLHNVEALSGKSNGFNIAQPRAGLVYEFRPKNEEVMLHLKCGIHSWMNAYLGIVSNPYFAVSNTKGTFQIDRVPPGTYAIEAWHERFGLVKKTISVKAGAVATIDFAYASPEK